jgi:hypothetical protein
LLPAQAVSTRRHFMPDPDGKSAYIVASDAALRPSLATSAQPVAIQLPIVLVIDQMPLTAFGVDTNAAATSRQSSTSKSKEGSGHTIPCIHQMPGPTFRINKVNWVLLERAALLIRHVRLFRRHYGEESHSSISSSHIRRLRAFQGRRPVIYNATD